MDFLHQLFRREKFSDKKKIISVSFLILCIVALGIVGNKKYRGYCEEQERIKIVEQQAKEEQARLEEARQREMEREAAVAALRQEYEQIIDARSLYNGLTAGLFYADYLDFDGDKKDELLLLSLSEGPVRGNYDYDNMSTVTWEVYSEAQGEVVECGKGDLMLSVAENKIALFQSGNSLYIGVYQEENASMNPIDLAYYSVDEKSLVLADYVSSWLDWSYEMNEKTTFYTSGSPLSDNPPVSLTEEEYQSIIGKYKVVKELFAFSAPANVSYDRGILPEPELTLDVQRRLEFFDILENADDIVYAKLIDVNQDGQEDLVSLRETSWTDYGKQHYFITYMWDGQQVQMLNLDHSADPEIDSYLEMGFNSYSLYRELATGKLYVCYDGEIVGGWGGTLFINATDADDYEFFEYPYLPIDFYFDDYSEFHSEEEIKAYEEQYATEEMEYEAGISRFTFMEYAYDYHNFPDSEQTVEAVRQQLINS